MDDLRFDPPRSSRSSPQSDAIRWFKIYTSWTYLYPTADGAATVAEPDPHDQYCMAQHCVRHIQRSNEWIETQIFETLYDPSMTSQPAVGTLVRAHYNPVNQHWEVWNPVTSSQNYVEYGLDKILIGFKSSGASSLILDASNLTGWPGSTYKAGTETYIQYQTSEASPDSNGLWKVLADGLYRITISGYVKFIGAATPSVATQSAVTTGPASAGTAHTHTVTQTGQDDFIMTSGPQLDIALYNKLASGGANAIHSDAIADFYRIITTGQITTGTRYQQLAAQWNVCLTTNDKVSLKFTGSTLSYHSWVCHEGNPLRVRFEYIGAKQEWAAL